GGGCAPADEARPWEPWLEELAAARRVVREADRWFAAEATRDAKAVLRGRLEALGPIFGAPADLALLAELEGEGSVLRTRVDGREAWCDRRLLARIHRYTLDRLRREIEPVTASEFLRFLAAWQHADPAHRLEGPSGGAEVVRQRAGFEVPAARWEGTVLPARVRGYRREWLDQLTVSGEVAWARLWGAGPGPIRRVPICLVPREDLPEWAALAAAGSGGLEDLSDASRRVYETLSARGAMFLPELARAARPSGSDREEALAALVSRGLATCDSFSGLRWLVVPSWRRSPGVPTSGRWSALAREGDSPASAEFVARRLIVRTGIVFRRTLGREK